jgi:glutathione S-transferase
MVILMNLATTHHQLVLCELPDPGLPGVESYSPFCIKVHRALRHARLAYARRHGDRPDAFKRYNPSGQVPVLLVDGEAVFDSTRILARIEAMSGVRLHSDLAARAEARLWEELADTVVNGFVVAARWADDRNWARSRSAYFGEAPWFVRSLIVPRIRARVIRGLHARDVWRHGPNACWDRFEVLLDDLEARAPASGFWMGDAISVADISLFAQLHSFRTPLTEPQRESVASRVMLSRWLDRVNVATERALNQ